MATIVFCLAVTANAQSSAELVEKAKTAIENNQFDLAIAESTKAIAIDSKNWAAYQVRGLARKKRAEASKTGFVTVAEKAEWQSIFDDYAKSASLSDQDMSAYDEFRMFMIKLSFSADLGAYGGHPEIFKEFRPKEIAYYRSLIAANPNNVCAYAFIPRSGTDEENRRLTKLGVEKFDGLHGKACSASAALEAASNIAFEAGDREANKKAAKRYYAIALERNPTITWVYDAMKDEAIDKAFAKADQLSSGVSSTPTPTPTPALEQRPPVNEEAALEARVDEFLKEYNRTMDEVAPLMADATNAMKKLLKASQEDLKYGTSTVNLYTGTRRRAQTQLDTIHGKYRGLIRKYEGSIPSMFINEVKKLDRSLPETVD